MDNTLVDDFTKNDCSDIKNLYKPKCNQFLLKKELLEREDLTSAPDTNQSLYPNINDPNFIVKIAKKKEFNDTTYDGSKHDIETYADEMKSEDFELAPHQLFVKNYLSFQTPYNSLLLYHQLGTGKTCSAIGICEEMRTYLKESGITKRILIVASPNVQDNFRLQLFDERKLKQANGMWTLNGCIGNTFIKEINPTNNVDLPKEKVVSQIKTLINKYYIFMGYESFSNYITRVSVENNPNVTESQIIKNLQLEFSNRLIVIDEVHNIRVSQENADKKVATQLMKLVTYVDNIRLLLLSATPMYNSAREIIWLLNLMNINDRRGQMDIKNVFDQKGELKESGRELLIRKATGYISYVRGENPYTFPFRVYPNIFDKTHSFADMPYPVYQLNGKRIPEEDRIKILRDKLYTSSIGSHQSNVYKIMINKMHKSKSDSVIDEISTFHNLDGFNYTILQYPLEALVMTYPMEGVDEMVKQLDPIYRSDKPSSARVEDVTDRSVEEVDTIQEEGDIADAFVLKPKYTQPEVVVEQTIGPDQLEDDPSEASMPVLDVPKRKRCPNGTRFNKKINECVDKKKEDPAAEEKPESLVLGDIEVEDMEDMEELPREVEPSKIEEDNVEVTLTRNPSSEKSIDSIGGGVGGGGGDGASESAPEYFVDTSALTGKNGLARIMSFVDTNSPPVKGSFSYKTDNYGRIFSPSEIGKYSNKIKSVCDHVTKSKGVILIYSQWIDSGLIPMALALEEMGLVRSNGTTLFKDPAAAPIGSQTMRPRDPDSSAKFVPARYALITGDTRLSPNNNDEIKLATGDDNKDGDVIKVVLISKAASEGIDLKCIRQVHILEPWYTLSRLEQIIGRAVRSFSHSLLPFSKRNVEIFMHGTILEDTEEESADIYIYRIAEYKAKQIGMISRILKETSVDCLLNTEQNNFTQVNMNTEVTQDLSDGQTLTNFKVGDIPYSAMCDYMEDCLVKCSPDAKISPSEINNDTYDEHFIMLNSEKIVQKVRHLMKEEFFYKKDNLLAKINHPKVYPRVEIYAALSHLINDTTETIVDKYGRSGHLVNIGDYYLFQPIEITAHHSSIFDRSAPIDHKISRLVVENTKKEGVQVNPEVVHTASNIHERETTNTEVPKKEGVDIVTRITGNYSVTMTYTKEEKLLRGEKSYYKHLGMSLQKIHKTLNTDYSTMQKYVIEHAVDILAYSEKLALLNYITSLKLDMGTSVSAPTNGDADSSGDAGNVQYAQYVQSAIKAYFDAFILVDKNITGIVLYDVKDRHILVLDAQTNQWKEGEEEDKRDLSNVINERYTIKESKFNAYIGFIANTPADPDLVFKVRDMGIKRAQGSRCDQSTKSKNIAILNKIIGVDVFTKENIKPIVDIGVCCMQEIILRMYNETKPDKVWFIDPDTAKMYNM